MFDTFTLTTPDGTADRTVDHDAEAFAIARMFANGERLGWPSLPRITDRAPGDCPRCADRGHERFTYSDGWRRCHAPGWKRSILAAADDMGMSASKRRTLREYLAKRAPADRWEVGCDTCNREDDDHDDGRGRRCGMDCCAV